jgi:glycosyltransferase 2 family protein
MLLSLAAASAGLLAGMLAWQVVLADLGSRPAPGVAVRIFFLGQLGKYLPGAVWPLLAQMQLGREHDVPRTRTLTVGLVSLALSLLAGLGTALVTLPFVGRETLTQYWYALLALPVFGLILVPAVANRLLGEALRLARRPPLERPLSARGLAGGLGWAVASWACFGLHLWLLTREVGADGPALLALCLGAFALAWCAGFLLVLAPAGAGVREAVLVLALAGELGTPAALLVALASRAVMTLGDVLWSGVALVLETADRARRRPVQP